MDSNSEPGARQAPALDDTETADSPEDSNAADLISAVRGKYLDLSRSDKKVARHLLDSPKAFITASVADVARNANVSEATVVRFGRTFNCRGFKDFKITLAQHLAARQALHDASNDAVQGRMGSFVDQICSSAATLLQDTAARLDLDAMESAARMIAAAGRVAIYGLGGSSGILATELHNRLFRLNIASASYSDSYMQRMSAASLAAGDVALFVSATGWPRALVQSAELARHYGAGTIALTDETSTLGEEVDVCLHVRLTQEGVAIEQPNPMRYAQLLVIDCLAHRVAQLRGSDARNALERARASVAALHGIVPQQPIGD